MSLGSPPSRGGRAGGVDPLKSGLVPSWRPGHRIGSLTGDFRHRMPPRPNRQAPSPRLGRDVEALRRGGTLSGEGR